MNRSDWTGWSTFALAIGLAACSATQTQQAPAGEPLELEPYAASLPPPGFGTLRQDAFTVALESQRVLVKLTPLNEAVIRLAAPDTYQRLHGLGVAHSNWTREQAERAGLRQDPQVFLVSFFTRNFQAAYSPRDVQVLSQGILYRPLGILPLTPEWGREQLKQEETQSALYLFDPAIDLSVLFEVEYAGVRAFDWAGITRTLEAERGRVLSRAKS